MSKSYQDEANRTSLVSRGKLSHIYIIPRTDWVLNLRSKKLTSSRPWDLTATTGPRLYSEARIRVWLNVSVSYLVTSKRWMGEIIQVSSTAPSSELYRLIPQMFPLDPILLAKSPSQSTHQVLARFEFSHLHKLLSTLHRPCPPLSHIPTTLLPIAFFLHTTRPSP
jgi:hypothetical protein